MNTVLNALEANKETILKEFNDVCNFFKVAGFPQETPRYYNFEEFDPETNKIYFKSSQSSKLKFWVTLDPSTLCENFSELINMDGSSVWDWFKKVRTNFLLDNHLTIEAGYKRFKESDIYTGYGTATINEGFNPVLVMDSKKVKNMLLECIDFDSYGEEHESTEDKAKRIKEIFHAEYVHQNNRHQNKIDLFAEWLGGLPSVLTVSFYYSDIINHIKSFEIGLYYFDKLTEDQQSHVLKNWFKLLAVVFNDSLKIL